MIPFSTTDPTNPDTENDGLLDGCEDKNKNGRLDPGELNPLDNDTDGDGLLDAVEDINENCTLDPGETDGTNPDTDSDGINDGIEEQNGTDPTSTDTDGDGIGDAIEDPNQNGQVDTGETDPLNPDTDGDGIDDGEEDSNQNGTTDPGETDPANPDSDNDGISDGEEINQGSDPSNPDSDGDGLTDGEENALGTDPFNPDSDNDGVSDGDEIISGSDPSDPNDPDPQTGSGIENICAEDALKVVNFENDVPGDWAVALETSYAYTPININGGNELAAVFDGLSSTQVAGFVLSLDPPNGGGNAVAEAQELISRITGNGGVLDASAIAVQNNGAQIITHDNFTAVVSIQINLDLSNAIDPLSLRDKILAVLSERQVSDLVGVPGTAGNTSDTYALQFEVVIRDDVNPTRAVLMGALVDKNRFDNNSLIDRIEIEDLANGTALAKANSGNQNACDNFDVNALPAADFIWMADTSGSTDNDRGTISTASGAVFQALANNNVDFRMAVVPHQENDITQGAGNGGDLRSGFTRDQQTFINDLENTGGNDGCEFGLTAASNAIDKALPRSAAEVSTKLRENVQLVVFYISDEHAQEVESQSTGCGNQNLGTGLTGIFQNDGNNHEQVDPNAAQQAAIDAIVDPFVSQIQAEGGIAFAQIHPLQAPFCFVDFGDDEEEGFGYFETVTQTGGTFYRVCDADPGAALVDIVDAVTGAASEFVLQEIPISSTIKVGITPIDGSITTEVPRSLEDGFDYDPGANTIFFRGNTFTPEIGDLVTVSYRLWIDPEPIVECDPPLILNPVTNQCECPSDCGIEGSAKTAPGCEANIGAGFFCNTDPNVCACECASDCNAICGGNTVCDTDSCGCVCEDTTPGDGEPDCGGTCTGNTECDGELCRCVCGDIDNDGAADCNNNCVAPLSCNGDTCACECLDSTPGDGVNDCGGQCAPGQACNESTCTCENVG